MNERDELTAAVERLLEASATFLTGHYVHESFKGSVVWQGEVSEYEVAGHPETGTCYAWKGINEKTGRPKFYAVLSIPPVDTPSKAVRAAIVRDFKAL